MSKVATGNSIGKEVVAMLGLPKNTISVDLRIAANEVVNVRCSYHGERDPVLRALRMLTKDYELRERSTSVRPKDLEREQIASWIRAQPLSYDGTAQWPGAKGVLTRVECQGCDGVGLPGCAGCDGKGFVEVLR